MKHYRSYLALSRIAAGTALAFALLVPAIVSAAGYPIVIPASSKDNGSRSVVSIDQGNIYNQINNAYSTGAQAQAAANGANGLAGAALNAANGANGAAARAQAAADAANSRPGGGFASPVNFVGFGTNSATYVVACIWGFSPASYAQFSQTVLGNGSPSFNQNCPAGSGVTLFSILPPGSDTAGDGSGGGGGAGGL